MKQQLFSIVGADNEAQPELSCGNPLTSNHPSSVLPRRAAVNVGAVPKPPHDMAFLTAAATVGDATALPTVTEHATCTILQSVEPELTELKGRSTHSREKRAAYSKRIARLSEALDATPPYVEIQRHAEPWNWFDRIYVIALGIVSFAVVLVGENCLATALYETGIPAFQHWLPRYLFSFVPVALPFALKGTALQCASEKSRNAYHTTLLALGILFGVLWAVMFATTFQGFAQTTGEMVQQLTTDAIPRASHGWLLVAFSIITEATLAAAIWLTMERVVAKHSTSVRSSNLAYKHTQKELNHWWALQEDETQYGSKVDGRIQALERAVTRYVREAETFFQAKRYANAARKELDDMLNSVSGAATQPQANHMPKVVGVLITICWFTIRSSAAESFVIGVASSYEPSMRDVVFQRICEFALEGAAPGDKLAIYDAFLLKPVATLDIPEGAIFRTSARARMQRMQAELAKLRTYFMAARPTPATSIGALDVPGFLGLVGSHLKRPGVPTTVILFGSALHVDSTGNFSTADAFPSDAHLSAPTPQESIFSTEGKKHALAGVTVHHCYLVERFVDEFHRDRLARFAALYCSEQSGVLVSWTASPEIVLQRVKDHIKEPFRTAQRDPSDTKVEMRQIVPRSIPKWFPPTNVLSAPLPTQPNIVPRADALPITLNPGTIGIGLLWTMEGVDIDLHVKPSATADELSFAKRQTAQGSYFHDYRNRNDHLDYEYVELVSGSDIRTIRAWAHLYSGRAKEMKGIVVVRANGKSYSSEFRIPATTGDGQSGGRLNNPHWVEIDLLRVIGVARR